MPSNVVNPTRLQQVILAKYPGGGVTSDKKIGVYIFGTGEGGRAALAALKTGNNEQSSYRVIGFMDNDPAKSGQQIDDIAVVNPGAVVIGAEDLIILASLNYYREMQDQLLEMGIAETQIIPPAGWLEQLITDSQQDWLLPENHTETNRRLLRNVLGRVCRGESAKTREFIFQSLIRKSLLIPLDFDHTVRHMPQDYVYPEVEALIDRNKHAIVSFSTKIKPYFLSDKLSAITDDKQNEIDPYWNNGFFSYGDARALYGIVAAYRPRMVVEVGAGNSTKFMRKAINDYGLSTQIISIDPEPRADIKAVSDKIISRNILDIDCDVLTDLRENDIFFIDGSHLAHCGTDVVHQFLNILPKIPRGVFVHFHDICLPYEYMPEYRVRHYNEQHMLASMLLYSDRWEIVFPVYYLYMIKAIEYGGASFWIRRV
jgi:hypothetical protein